MSLQSGRSRVQAPAPARGREQPTAPTTPSPTSTQWNHPALMIASNVLRHRRASHLTTPTTVLRPTTPNKRAPEVRPNAATIPVLLPVTTRQIRLCQHHDRARGARGRRAPGNKRNHKRSRLPSNNSSSRLPSSRRRRPAAVESGEQYAVFCPVEEDPTREAGLAGADNH